MPSIVAGFPISLEAQFVDGDGQIDAATDVFVDIIDADGVTILDDVAATAVGPVGLFQYVYTPPAEGPLGTWSINWHGTVDGAPAVGTQEFSVLAPGSVTPASAAGCNGSWVPDVLSICPCSPSEFDDEDGDTGSSSGVVLLEEWTAVASQLLYARTGQRFPGVCTDTVRPCRPRSAAVQSVAYAASGGSRPLVGPGLVGSSCTCEPPSDGMAWGCGCGHHGAILLPHLPVRRVYDVLIEGVVVDPAEYRLVDRRWLVRNSGSWPCCQNLGAADGEPGTWSVTYSYGTPPPAGGAQIAAVYGCELAKGCVGDTTCRLPRRVQSITREGITMTLIDPFDFFEQGLTGLYEVDAWIAALNPAKIDRPGKVINVDLLMSHRVRP